jgi:transposase
MLTVEERFMIKQMHREGLSVSEIARRTGHDRKTIRARLAEPLVTAPMTRESRGSKLDAFIPYLEKRIGVGVLNASKLYDEIRALGYTGKDRLVRGFVQPYREARRREAEATVRFETEPGEQAQVDWGHFGTLQHQARQRKLYAFVMTLGWSRAMYLEFTVATDATWWLRCHVHAFDYFGGVPQEVLHDNLKTAVLSRDIDATIHWHPRYLDFAAYHGFTPRACAPYRARTKGKVERGVRYVRGNFWVGLTFSDLDDLNQQARSWTDTVANVRVHGTTGAVPWERLPLEQLASLPRPPYDTSLIGYRRSTRDCVVSYGGNYYSVPAAHSQQQLLVKETEDAQLIIATLEGVEIARHRLVTGRHERVVIAEHFASLAPAARPRARGGAVQVMSAGEEASVPDAPVVEQRPLDQYAAWAEVRV